MFKNLFTTKTKADKIVDEIDSLTAKKQKVQNDKNVKNNSIQNKMKALEYRANQNQVKADNVINEIDRKLDKLKRDLQSEKDYVNSIKPTDELDRHMQL